MAELHPCPNPSCFHWNPGGRKKCFACKAELTEEEALDGSGGAGLLWVGIAALGVILGLTGWIWLRGRDDEKAGPKAAAPSGPLEIRSLDVEDGSYSTAVTLELSGTASGTIASATVAGQPATVQDATFTASVPLTEGVNAIEVVLTDAAGQQATRVVTVRHHAQALPAGFAFTESNAAGQEVYAAAKDGARLVLVPAGPFTMGASSGDADEQPEHQVTLAPFFMDEKTVTNEQYAKFVAEAGHAAPQPPDFDAAYFSTQPGHPVLGVSWEDASAYAAWAGRRLPTEAEWEKAARGTTGAPYPWGSQVPDAAAGLGNFKGDADGHAAAAPAGSFPKGASPYGLLDMAGNVWQWTADRYGARYYAESPAQDPPGPERGAQRVLRGGAFTSEPEDARSTNRYARSPGDRASNVSFRTAASFGPAAP